MNPATKFGMVFGKETIVEVVSFAKRLAVVDMQPQVVFVEIDGLVYTSQKIPAMAGLTVWPRVVSVVGRGVDRALATGDDEGIDWFEAGMAFVERANRDGLGPLVSALLARMQCNKRRGHPDGGPIGEGATFDLHFAGEYLHLLKVCIFAYAHNFRGPTYGRHSSSGAPWPSPYPPSTEGSSSPTSTP